MKLVIIGSTNIDLVIALPRIPMLGETVLGGKSSMFFGGKGANQAVAAMRSGAEVAFIAKVGNDLFGKDMKKHFEAEGFNLKHILTDEDEATGMAQIFVSEKGENSIAVASGANMKLMPKDLEPFEDLIINAEVLLLQLETPLETVEFMAQKAVENKFKLILNPAPAQKLSEELLKKIWLITPNETEASLLTGVAVSDENFAEKAGKKLLELGVENVIITLGASGSVLFNSFGSRVFPAFKVDAVDSTAAGDVFNGTLASAYTRGNTLEQSIEFASAASAISVTRFGAQASIPTQVEIDDFIRYLK